MFRMLFVLHMMHIHIHRYVLVALYTSYIYHMICAKGQHHSTGSQSGAGFYERVCGELGSGKWGGGGGINCGVESEYAAFILLNGAAM